MGALTLGWDEFAQLCADLAGHAPRQLSRERPIWIFGAGGFGRALGAVLLAQGYPLAGFIETAPRIDQALGLPVRAWGQLDASERTAQLAIGIFNRGMPYDDLAALAREHGFGDIFLPWHTYAQFEQALGWRYWLSNPQTILDALPAIKATWDSLSDDTSRQCLLGILSFRLGQNLGYAGTSHPEPQYFNALTLPALRGKDLVYVDGGAYNGDTWEHASAEMDLAQSWLFEPEPENYRTMVERVRASGRPATCLPCAVSDGYGILSFEPGGEAAAIVEGGSQRIVTLALDELLPTQRVDMIKLDVEGAEIVALNGARKLIERSRPVLALSLYHLPRDPWEIPALVRSMCPGYRFYIRQHCLNSFDSVFYAVPDAA